MTTIISGSSPSITFSDSTTQTTAFTSTPSVTSITTSADSTIHGITVGLGASSVSTNTAVGSGALQANTTGAACNAVGYHALYLNQSGSNNQAVGSSALAANVNGSFNTAFGDSALAANVSANDNSAFGQSALVLNQTGAANVALGRDALHSNLSASNNTAVGYQAGYLNQTGTDNLFLGRVSGYNTTTSGNTFVGADAGFSVTSGAKNTILGRFNGNQGGIDIRTTSNNIVLSDGDGNVRLFIYGSGYFTTGTGTSSPYNNASGSGANMVVGSDGALFRSTSSLKYKTDVQDATFGIADVLKLRAVTYKGKGKFDGDKVFAGLIAEEVHDSGLTQFVQYADDGSPDSLSYGNMVSLCIKALQELNAKFDAYVASHP